MFTDSIAWTFMVAVIAAQAAAPDWGMMVSPYFAFAAAAFLIWSLVQLVNVMFRHTTSATADTISTLREQIAALRKFQDETLVGMIGKVSSAMERDADASNSSTRAWNEVHEDFRDLIAALRVRPCLHDSDLPPPPKCDERTIAAIEKRNARKAGGDGESRQGG